MTKSSNEIFEIALFKSRGSLDSNNFILLLSEMMLNYQLVARRRTLLQSQTLVDNLSRKFPMQTILSQINLLQMSFQQNLQAGVQVYSM